MEMIKASHWTVRGELEFHKQITLQSRHYLLVDTEPYVGARGNSSELLVWEGTCTVCDCNFTFTTTRSRFYPTATCVKHRPESSRS